MKKTISIAAIALVWGFSACQEEEFGYTAGQINYESSFVKNFGMPDPLQNWSTLNTARIRYTLPSDGIYSVYVTSHALNYRGDNFLVASAEQVMANGEEQTIRFDMPKGYNIAYLTVCEESTHRAGTEAAVICDGEGKVNFTGKALTANADALDNLKQSSYVIAFEDLGGTCDWDFNDVVVGVTRSGASATFELRTVGGTLPAKLVLGNQTLLFGERKSDLHEAFGVAPDIRVNVAPGEDLTPEVASKCQSNFSPLTCTADVDANATMTEILQGFKLVVGDAETAINAANETSTSSAPQAIVIYEGAQPWQCPAEGQKISDKHSDFDTWVTNANLGQFWYGKAWGEPESDPNSIPEGTSDDTPTVAQAPRR